MATITSLRPARRRTGYLDLEVDGEPLGPVPEREVAARGLAVGQSVDEQTLEELRSVSAVAAALGLANGFLAHRPRSASEVRQRLRKGQFDEQTITGVLEALTAQGLLNDERFAAMWVENRTAFSPRSSRSIEMELRRKGIDRESIDTALSESGNDDQALALEAGRRKMRAYATSDEDLFRKRMSGYLARRGFGYEAVASAVTALWAEALEAG